MNFGPNLIVKCAHQCFNIYAGIQQRKMEHDIAENLVCLEKKIDVDFPSLRVKLHRLLREDEEKALCI